MRDHMVYVSWTLLPIFWWLTYSHIFGGRTDHDDVVTPAEVDGVDEYEEAGHDNEVHAAGKTLQRQVR